MKTTAIYLRVSTTDQRLDSQQNELREYCQRRGWAKVKTYTDHASGSAADRVGLEKLMADVRAGKLARLIVYKLDRLGRSLTHLALILEELTRHGVALICTSQGIDTNADNPAGRLQLGVLMAVSQFERELIRERVVAGLDAARKRGVKLGRPGMSAEQRKAVIGLASQGVGVREIARRLGVPKSSVGDVCREVKGG